LIPLPEPVSKEIAYLNEQPTIFLELAGWYFMLARRSISDSSTRATPLALLRRCVEIDEVAQGVARDAANDFVCTIIA
jgi:hypothetical protein